MRCIIIFTTLLFLMFQAFSGSLAAQELGVFKSFHIVYHNGQMPSYFSDEKDFTIFNEHISAGNSFGIYFNNNLSERTDLELRMSYHKTHFYFDNIYYFSYMKPIYDKNGTKIGSGAVSKGIKFNAQGNVTLIGLDTKVRVKLTDRLSFVSGPSLNYCVGSFVDHYQEAESKYQKFESDKGGILASDSLRIDFYEGDLQNMNDIFYGAIFGLDYEVIRYGFILRGEFLFTYYFNDIINTDPWKMMHFNFGVSVSYDLGKD